jgi:hypothetical protein
MKRRDFVEKVGIGTTAVAAVPALAGAQHTHGATQPGQGQPPGVLTNIVVSFGQWQTDPPLDRFPNLSPGGPNLHFILPSPARLKAGGTVTFAIAGLHQVQVYGPGTQPGDISTATTTPTTGTPAGVALIDDSRARVYRGLDPSLHPRDRVEVVYFPRPGTFLVICGVLGHFLGGMYGFVEVQA